MAAASAPPRSAPLPRFGVGAVVGALLAAGVVGFSPAGNDASNSAAAWPNQAGSGSQSSASPTVAPPALAVPVGGCAVWSGPEAADISAVDCTQPHLMEITGEVDLSTKFDAQARFPDTSTWQGLVQRRCGPMSTEYLGAPLDSSGRLSISSLKPSQESWSSGDRTVRCGLQALTPTGAVLPLTATARGADQAVPLPPGSCLAANGKGVGGLVDCSQPHAVELAGAVDLTELFPTATSVPSRDEQMSKLNDSCSTVADTYAGADNAVIKKGLVAYGDPLDQPSWQAGTRLVSCKLAALLPDKSGFAPVTGSVTGEVDIGSEPAGPATPSTEQGAPALPLDQAIELAQRSAEPTA